MKIIDPGHKYEVNIYDGNSVVNKIEFLKREGDGYPFNKGQYPGTNCQELLRVLIDRVKYLDKQISCEENKRILIQLRLILWEFECRAARRHGRRQPTTAFRIEDEPHCIKCGHIKCEHIELSK